MKYPQETPDYFPLTAYRTQTAEQLESQMLAALDAMVRRNRGPIQVLDLGDIMPPEPVIERARRREFERNAMRERLIREKRTSDPNSLRDSMRRLRDRERKARKARKAAEAKS